MEKTLIIIKPDAMQRGLAGKIIQRFEEKGLKIVAMKLDVLTDEKLDEHYAHVADKPFYSGLAAFMKSTPVILMVLEGPTCTKVVRGMLGVTDSTEAEPGTIRGDLGMSIQNNLVHASESVELAEKEVQRFFKPEELKPNKKVLDELIFGRE